MTRVRLRGNGARLAAPGLLAIISVAAFAFVYWATVRTEPGRLFGNAALRGAIRTHSRLANAVNDVLSVVSVASLLAGVAAIALIGLARLRREAGLVAVAIVVAANVTTWVLKRYLLPRPDLGLSELSPATHNSLPSGHTTAVFSVVVALLFVLPARWRRPVALVGGAGAVLIALATMSAGWHRAGDSVAALFVVGLWAALAAVLIVLPSAAVPTSLGHHGARRPARRLVVLTLGATGVGLVFALVLAMAAPVRHSVAGAGLAFVAGGLFIVVTAVAVLFAVLVVLDRLEA